MTPQTKTTTTTGVAASQCIPRSMNARNSQTMLNHYQTQINHLKSTGPTTKGATHQETCGGLREKKTPETFEALFSSITKAARWLQKSSLNSMCVDFSRKLLLGLLNVGSQERRFLSRNPNVSVPVYDILSAGPRNRFSTASVVAHNCLGCGYGVGPDKFVVVAKVLAGMNICPKEAKKIVTEYRAQNPKVTALWRKLDSALKRSVGSNFELELPSGRVITYWNVSNVGGNISAVTCRNGKMMRGKFWGSHLSENCLAGETEVLSEARGWVRLDSVTEADSLWDGGCFVNHGGLLNKGPQTTMLVHGVKATPDHLFLSASGWVPSTTAANTDPSEITFKYDSTHMEPCRYNGSEIRRTNDSGADGQQRKTHSLESGMLLRGDYHKDRGRLSKGGVLRTEMSKTDRAHVGVYDRSWDVAPPSLRGVAVYGGSVLTAYPSRMEKLRRSWDFCLCFVGQLFRDFLEGYGSYLRQGAGLGSGRQQPRVFKRELSVGNQVGEQPKQTRQLTASLSLASRRLSGAGGCCGGKQDNALLQNQQQCASGVPVRPRRLGEELSAKLPFEEVQHPRGAYIAGSGAGVTPEDTLSASSGRVVGGTCPERKAWDQQRESVYDILNCGPNHRFAVRAAGSRDNYLIAHNCIQASARDTFAEKLLNLEAEGLMPILHVHDEAVCLVPEEQAEEKLNKMIEIMSTTPDWMPGLPLAAEGVISDCYTK